MEDLFASLKGAIRYLPEAEQQTVLLALQRAIELHGDQKRESGEPYVTHPIAVAIYLTGLEANGETLAAALLHDVVEDGHISLQDLQVEFGSTIANLVDGVTKLSKIAYEGKRAERQVASLRKMLLTANEDLRVIFIKLADRWHNISTIHSLRPDKQERIAQETLDIYVPFARLLGLWELKSEFERVSFSIAYPEEAGIWHTKIEEGRREVDEEREQFIARVNEETTDLVEARLYRMTDYEIFQRLQGNLLRLDDVRNIDTALIILKDPGAKPIDCYRVLGEIHSKYPVRIGAFRDYISAPQPNGYQALHTTIFLSREHRLRLRIQTEAMYSYGANRKLSAWLDADNDVYKALTSLHKHPNGENENYLNELKNVILNGRINVFTTSGEIISLPRDATGVDFAFELNPDHLAYLSGIRVNGDVKEATHTLKDGDTVDLLLVKNGEGGMANPLWLEKIKSVEAKEGIKKSLQDTDKDIRMQQGKSLLQIECRKHRLPTWWLFHLPKFQKQLAQRLNQSSFTVMLEQLGSGQIPLSKVIEVYRELLLTPPSILIRVLRTLHLLPRSRVFDKESAILDIEVYALDRKGLIHDITKCFADREINIAKFGVFAVPPADALYKIRLEVKNFKEFSDLYDALIQVPNVQQVLRKS